jgi:hypothetical protein
VLASEGNVGKYSSLTIGANGLGLIVHYDVTNTNLVIASCRNTACTAATSLTLDNTGAVGSYASITVGVDGFPLVSYHDATNANLNVVHCGSRFCTPYFRTR